jgi:hypothetical protein
MDRDLNRRISVEYIGGVADLAPPLSKFPHRSCSPRQGLAVSAKLLRLQNRRLCLFVIGATAFKGTGTNRNPPANVNNFMSNTAVTIPALDPF